jgi:hypothetical protein
VAALEADELERAARAVLAAILTSADELGVLLPERQLLTAGGVVYDCEEVAVTLINAGTGIVGADQNPMSDLAPIPAVWNVTVGCAIVRRACEMPVGPRGQLPPTPDMIEADMVQMSADAAVLTGAAAALAGTRLTGFPQVNLTFQQTEGGLVAVTTSVTMNPWGL